MGEQKELSFVESGGEAGAATMSDDGKAIERTGAAINPPYASRWSHAATRALLAGSYRLEIGDEQRVFVGLVAANKDISCEDSFAPRLRAVRSLMVTQITAARQNKE